MRDFQSRIEGARRLQATWFAQRNLVEALNRALDSIGFSEAYVAECVGLGERRPDKKKAIKDLVWGMMEFDGAAMRLIDSPILQRLRHIRQLGFSYLTYASAEHSRFPHSIGMAHVVTRFAASIERNKEGIPGEMQPDLDGFKSIKDLGGLTIDDLVHAALLHDVGHLPFSHAAENAVEASRDLFRFGGASYEDFKDRAEYFLKGQLSLSEAISLLVVLSPRFVEFYTKYVQRQSDLESPLRLACLIAGQRVLDNCGNIQDIISSSSVDADKIDYVNRDASECGIPIGVDVSRVFLGSSLVGLQAKKSEELGYSPDDRFVFALNASGWDTFDEIIRARSTLYQRVYLHAVTRTAEALFARALKINAIWVSETEKDTELSDVISLWAQHDDSVIDNLARVDNLEVRRLGAALRDRRLPKKACALGASVFSMQVPIKFVLPKVFGGPAHVSEEAFITKLVVNPFLRNYTRGHEDAVDSVEFENQTKDEAHLICERLNDVDSSLVPLGELENVVLIAIAALDERKTEAPVFQHGELLSADVFTNVRGVSDASDYFRQIGYVMAPFEWRELVCVAVRSVLYRRSLSYQVINFDASDGSDGGTKTYSAFPLTLLDIEGIVRRTGLSRTRLTRVMDALSTTDYFNTHPILARRTPPNRVSDLDNRYGKFSGEDGWSIGNSSIAAFVDQFPPRLRGGLIECLGRGAYLDRAEIVQKLTRTVRDFLSSEKINVSLVPLSISSSGDVWSGLRTSLSNDERVSFHTTLSAALEHTDDSCCIILVDDNAASGIQSASQLYAYSGKVRGEWPVDLRNESTLLDNLSFELWSRLQARKLAIAVAVGHQTARDRLSATALDLGLTQFRGLFSSEQIGANVVWPAELRSFLEQVGRDLIAYDRWNGAYEGLSSEQQQICENHAFGYGAFGGLTILASTVPTSTVTALWLPGFWQGRPWIPLAIRWGRLNKVTFA
ncbi:HD domain-containing protein [Methylovirgula sp. HY1]|uniref:phosphoribosyltransferase-like protein n=1 Tax=Methylovirgula sp. HY1 TaxID=2822761 RepID=UPI001C5AB8EC|nr:HD domain-containing protein [Methylovirgula sp. HY1]QXX73785.1 hypothetical protein MHY1_00585 [Methylovirgula sp. HY1]